MIMKTLILLFLLLSSYLVHAGAVFPKGNYVHGIKPLDADTGGSNIPYKILYVDLLRPICSSGQNGSFTCPFAAIQTAVNQVATNNDNAIYTYVIDIAPGNYLENVTLNDSRLYAVIFDGHDSGAVFVAPSSGYSFSSTTNNDQLWTLAIRNIATGSGGAADLNLVGAINNSSFLLNGGVFRDGVILGNSIIKNVGAFVFDDVQSYGNLTLENVPSASWSGGAGQAPGTATTVTTNLATNHPSGFGQTAMSYDFNVAGSDLTCGAGSLCQYRFGDRIGYPGGTITANGEVRAYTSFFRSNVVVNSGGTLSSRGSEYATGSTITKNAGGTVTEAGYHNHLLANGASDATNAALIFKDGHAKSTITTAPTAAPNANAGTGATCSLSNATDVAGTINLTTTGVASASGVICDVTFNKAYNVAPICTTSPTSSNAIVDAVIQGVYFTTSTTKLTINFANSDLVGRTYNWMFHCLETQ